MSLGNAVLLIRSGGTGRTTIAVDDVSELAAALLAATACCFAAHRNTGRSRIAWLLIGAYAACWGLGQVAWAIQEVILNENPQDLFPSWPDLGFLFAVPFGLAGLLTLPAGVRGLRAQARRLLDGLLIASALLFVSWATVLGPIYANSPSDLLQQVVGLAYPICDVALITIVLLTLSRVERGPRLPLMLVGTGVLCSAVADTTFAYLTTVQNFDTSNLADVGWILGFGLIGVGAVRSWSSPGTCTLKEVNLELWRMALPYVAVAAAMPVALVRLIVLGDSLNGVLLWDGLFLAALTLGRQFLLVRETTDMARTIENHNAKLDALVIERTQELRASLERLGAESEVRRELLVRLTTTQDDERREIAEIIHDDMLQSMISAKMRLYLLEDESDEARSQDIGAVDRLIGAAVDRMRSLMTDLRPQALDSGLTAALLQYIEDAGCHACVRGSFSAEPAESVGATMFRIVREALVNAHKHAPDAAVTIDLAESVGGYHARVRDDGPGFAGSTTSSPRGHLGLTSMRERAEALGGSLNITSAPGKGTSIDLCIPQPDHRSAGRSTGPPLDPMPTPSPAASAPFNGITKEPARGDPAPLGVAS